MTIYYTKNEISLMPASGAHLRQVARRLRAADRAELAASHPGDPERRLKEFAARSRECLALVYKGRAAAVFGLSPDSLLGPRACVWLLTAEDTAKIPKTFFKLSRLVLAHWLARYPQLYNWVDARYAPALAYVRRLGGGFDGAARVFNGQKFLLFNIRRK